VLGPDPPCAGAQPRGRQVSTMAGPARQAAFSKAGSVPGSAGIVAPTAPPPRLGAAWASPAAANSAQASVTALVAPPPRWPPLQTGTAVAISELEAEASDEEGSDVSYIEDREKLEEQLSEQTRQELLFEEQEADAAIARQAMATITE
ncbi:unnamed protein product, partial [Polarella glacialis]